MRTQKIIVPEIVYNSKAGKRNESGNSYSNNKTAAMLTAAMLALAANARADVCLCKNCKCASEDSVIVNNISDSRLNTDENVNKIAASVAIPVLIAMIGYFIFYQNEKQQTDNIYKGD